MKQSYSNVAFFAIIACVAYIAVAAAMPPPPPPPSPTLQHSEGEHTPPCSPPPRWLHQGGRRSLDKV